MSDRERWLRVNSRIDRIHLANKLFARPRAPNISSMLNISPGHILFLVSFANLSSSDKDYAENAGLSETMLNHPVLVLGKRGDDENLVVVCLVRAMRTPGYHSNCT